MRFAEDAVNAWVGIDGAHLEVTAVKSLSSSNPAAVYLRLLFPFGSRLRRIRNASIISSCLTTVLLELPVSIV